MVENASPLARSCARTSPLAPCVSVVLPTFQRPLLLERCVGALVLQTLPKALFEILVCDDAHSETIREWVLQEAQKYRPGFLRYVRPLHGKGPAAARNCGWHAATADTVAFTDDDTIPEPDWLVQGWNAMQHCRASVLAGRVVVPWTEQALASGPTDHERMTRGLERAEFVTANAFIRKTALARVHGFDERFTKAWREDSDLQFRLEMAGFAIERCETAIVLHPVRRERWGISVRQQANVYFDALLYRKHPRLYRARIRQQPPWDYYAIVCLSVLAMGLMAWGWRASAFVCGAFTAVLILAFATRRLRGTSHTSRHIAEMLVTSACIPYLSVFWRVRGALRFRAWFW